MNIVTKDFIFLHLQKTGGSTLRRLVYSAVMGSAPQKWPGIPGYATNSLSLPRTLEEHSLIRFEHPDTAAADHETVDHIPECYKYLPIIGAVRNPFTWYVSWFNTWDRPGLRDHIGDISDFDTFVRDKAGLYSQKHKQVYQNRTDIHYVRVENQREEFIKVLGEIRGHPVPEELCQVLCSIKPLAVRATRTKPYRQYYSDSLIESVRLADSYLFDTFYPDREFSEEPKFKREEVIHTRGK